MKLYVHSLIRILLSNTVKLKKNKDGLRYVRYITYVYHSLELCVNFKGAPADVPSLVDLLNRKSWSFCFTSVLATAPVRPGDTHTQSISITPYTCLIHVFIEFGSISRPEKTFTDTPRRSRTGLNSNNTVFTAHSPTLF